MIAIDACATERRTRLFRDEIARLSDQPVRTLVNTHAHLDHTFGNYLFSDAVIVGHTNCRTEILHDGPEMPARARQMFPSVDWGDVEVVAPSLTFDDRLTLYAGELEIELNLRLARPHQHRRGRLDSRAQGRDRRRHRLQPGHAVRADGLRRRLARRPRQRARTRRRVDHPGHGPVAGPAVLDDVADYLRFIQASAKSGFDAGAGPLEVARDADLGRFAEWTDSERLVGNLHRAYSGTPRRTTRLQHRQRRRLLRMLDYNGGQPLRCLA